jgi:hypothetical protein
MRIQIQNTGMCISCCRIFILKATAVPALSCLKDLLRTSPQLLDKHVADLGKYCRYTGTCFQRTVPLSAECMYNFC